MAVEVAQPEHTADQLVGRLFNAALGMFDVMSVYVGDRLGLYRARGSSGSTSRLSTCSASID